MRMVLCGGGVSLPVAGGGGYGESASQSAVESKVGRFCVDHGCMVLVYLSLSTYNTYIYAYICIFTHVCVRANILFIPIFYSISRNNLYPPTQTHTHTHTHIRIHTHVRTDTHSRCIHTCTNTHISRTVELPSSLFHSIASRLLPLAFSFAISCALPHFLLHSHTHKYTFVKQMSAKCRGLNKTASS